MLMTILTQMSASVAGADRISKRSSPPLRSRIHFARFDALRNSRLFGLALVFCGRQRPHGERMDFLFQLVPENIVDRALPCDP